MAGEHRTVSRVTTILERVAAAQTGVRLAELAAMLDAPRSSVHGMVKGLVATGYLHQEDSAYVTGPAAGALLMAAPPTLDLTARPEMEKLHRQFDETVMLASQVGDSVVYTLRDRIDPRRPILRAAAHSATVISHQRREMHTRVPPARMRENYLATHISEPEQRDLVRRELTEIAIAGVATNRSETEPDDSGVASPILIGDQLAAVMCVSGPTSRILSHLDEIALATKEAAHEISERMRGARYQSEPR